MPDRRMKYKIVIFDIGKTLFDKSFENQTSEVVLKDIISLRKQGIKVGVCTMRTVDHCMKVVPTDLDFYISLNGSYIVCDGNPIYKIPMDFNCDKKDFLTCDEKISYYSSNQAKEYAINNGFLFDQIGIAKTVYNAVIFNVNSTDLQKYSNYHLEFWENTGTLSIQSQTASKSRGIERVMNFYGINEPILYFGDGPNDLEIFKTYRDCICMGDCYPPLEKYALMKTETCKQNGISVALRKLKLL